MLALFLCRFGCNKALLLYSAGTKVAVSAHGMHFESMNNDHCSSCIEILKTTLCLPFPTSHDLCRLLLLSA